MKSKICSIVLTPAFFLAAILCSTSPANEPAPGEKPVQYQRISAGEYQNFVKNWDDKKDPSLCALIRSAEEYSAVFHPAPVMRGNKPFAPDKDLYDKEQIIVVAKVMPAPADMGKAFDNVVVAESGDILKVYFKMSEAKSDATYTVKNSLTLRIPKKDYKSVQFIEAGKQIAELKPSEGAWCNIKLAAE